MLPFIVAGLVTGSIYGLCAVGLVLTYKTSGVFNFAQGAIATVGAYAFYELHVQQEMPWQQAAVITVLGTGLVFGLLLERLARALQEASLADRVVATIGVFLVVQAAILLIYGSVEVRTVPQYLPTRTHEIFGTVVTEAQIIVFVSAILATATLYMLFRATRLGMAMRAVVDDPELLDVAGTNPVRVRRSAWVIGTCFAAAAGVLIAPLQASLSSVNLTILVLQAFGAAAIGAFTSLPLTFVGGLLIGAAGALCTKFFTTGLLASLPPTLSFLVLFVALLVFPRGKLAATGRVVPRSAGSWTTPWQIQLASVGVILTALLFVPSFAGVHMIDWTVAVANVLGFLALGLLVRTSGQVSLCHVSFLAIGACSLSHLAVDKNVPWMLAVLLSGLIAIPIGAVLAIPAIRLSGLYLALATFGFGLLLSVMFYTEDFMFGANGNALQVPRPKTGWLDLSSDTAYYYFVLAVVVAVTFGIIALNRSRLGRLLRAMADSPTALVTGGTSVRVAQLLVFCLTAFLSAIAGALAAAAETTATTFGYDPLLSLSYVALIMITFGREPWYALQAAIALTLVPSYFPEEDVTHWLTLVFGAAAVLHAFAGPGLERLQSAASRVLDPAFRNAARTRPTELQATSSTVSPGRRDLTLAVEDLTVSFGGLVAVDTVTLQAPTGRITGLIGPNGAGKTTTFNACSGLNRPSHGRILLDDKDVSRIAAAGRSRRGVGRTFQQMELYDSHTVEENVRLGVETGLAGANPLTQVWTRPGQRQRIAGRAHEAMELCGIADLAQRDVRTLSTGQRRLVELARCLAGDFAILLLDEPSSGLDRAETAAFGEILERVVAERGVGILLVEHDMALVMDICAYIYVLDFGEPIFEGTPVEVQASSVVRSAYLGTHEVVENTSSEQEVRA